MSLATATYLAFLQIANFMLDNQYDLLQRACRLFFGVPVIVSRGVSGALRVICSFLRDIAFVGTTTLRSIGEGFRGADFAVIYHFQAGHFNFVAMTLLLAFRLTIRLVYLTILSTPNSRI